MRTIKVKKNNHHLKYIKDIQLIQDTLIDKGFYASPEQCAELWEMYSSTFETGWMQMEYYSKDDIYSRIQRFFEPGPEGSVDTRYL
jgi:hypothetical protein